MRAAQAKGVSAAAPGAPARRIDLIAPCVYFGGINYTGEGFSLVVRAHAP